MRRKQYKIELSDEAEVDLDKSYEYYANENEDLADNFYRYIANSIEEIRKNPNLYPDIHKNIRKFVIKKFPFVIYYKINDVVVEVVAIFHTSRNPEIWQERKSKINNNKNL